MTDPSARSSFGYSRLAQASIIGSRRLYRHLSRIWAMSIGESDRATATMATYRRRERRRRSPLRKPGFNQSFAEPRWRVDPGGIVRTKPGHGELGVQFHRLR